MKTISAILLLTGAVSFQPTVTESGAKPQKMQGIDVYVMSEPTRPYEVLETNTSVRFGSCDFFVNSPINKAAKLEGAQGVIIYFPQSSKYSIIKYKD